MRVWRSVVVGDVGLSSRPSAENFNVTLIFPSREARESLPSGRDNKMALYSLAYKPPKSPVGDFRPIGIIWRP